MKIIRLDSFYWVPNEVTPQELTQAITRQSQKMFEIDKELKRDLKVDRVKWSGMAYDVKPSDG